MHTRRLIVTTMLALAAAGSAQATGDDLAWMSGRWCSGSSDERVEEVWLTPAGGHLLGVSRTLKLDRLSGFEYLRIGLADGVMTYFAQPGGRPPTAFARVDGGADWVRFENTAHDFPQRIEYRRSGDALQAEISGPGEGGKELRIPIPYTRCPD